MFFCCAFIAGGSLWSSFFFFFLFSCNLYEVQLLSFFQCSFLFEISLSVLQEGGWVRRGFLKSQLQSSLFCHIENMAWDFLRSGCVLLSLPLHYHLDFLFPFFPVSLSLSICILFPAVFLSRRGALAGWFQELCGLDSSSPLRHDCRFLVLTYKSSVQNFLPVLAAVLTVAQCFSVCQLPVDSVEVLLFPSVRCPVASLCFLHRSWYISVLQLLVICPFSIVFCSLWGTLFSFG